MGNSQSRSRKSYEKWAEDRLVIASHPSRQRRALIQAIRENKDEKVFRILDCGLNPNFTDKDVGVTPLHWAAYQGRLPLVGRLIAAGAKINATTSQGGTPLHEAARWGQLPVVEFLITAGVLVDATDSRFGETPLHWAAFGGQVLVVERLIKAGAQVDAKGKSGLTPLAYAVANKKTAVIQALLKVGADIRFVGQEVNSSLTEHLREQGSQKVTQEAIKGITRSTNETVETREFKIIILGEVLAGKTSLRKTVCKKASMLEREEDRTIAVEVDRLVLDDTTVAHLYDFGGHDTYAFFHQMFLGPHAVNDIITDLSDYDFTESCFNRKVGVWYKTVTNRVIAPVIQITGTKMDQYSVEHSEKCEEHIFHSLKILEDQEISSLKYSYHEVTEAISMIEDLLPPGEGNISERITNHYVGLDEIKQKEFDQAVEEILEDLPGVDKINIWNHAEHIKYLIDHRPVLKPHIRLISSKSMNGIDDWMSDIKDLILKNEDLFPAHGIPTTWKEFQNMLEKEERTLVPVMGKEEFRELCIKQRIVDIEELDLLLNYLRVVGRILHYQDNRPLSKLANVVFIKPWWVLGVFARIFNHYIIKKERRIQINEELLRDLNIGKEEIERMIENLQKKAMIEKSLLKYLLSLDGIKGKLFEQIVSLLEQFDVCYKVKQCPSSTAFRQNDLFLFPALLFEEETDEVKKLWPVSVSPGLKQFSMQIQYNCRMKPAGLFEKVSVRASEVLIDRHDWKDGFIGRPDLDILNSKAWIRVEHFVDESKGQVNVNITARTEPEHWAEVYILLQTLVTYLKWLKKHYPSTMLTIWIMCPDCILASIANPKVWPADRLAFVPAITVKKVYCEKCKEDKPLYNVFPSPKMVHHILPKTDPVVKEDERHGRLFRMMNRVVTPIFRAVVHHTVDHLTPTISFQQLLLNNYSNFCSLPRGVMNATQWKLLYPPPASAALSCDSFDVTLMMVVVRNLTDNTNTPIFPEPSPWWNIDKLLPTNHDKEADFMRIQHWRNTYIAHTTTISEDDFNQIVTDLAAVVGRLESNLMGSKYEQPWLEMLDKISKGKTI